MRKHEKPQNETEIKKVEKNHFLKKKTIKDLIAPAGIDATHTNHGETPSYYISHHDLDFPLKHPKYVVPYLPFEKAFHHKLNDKFYEKLKRLLPFSLKMKIKSLLKK